jgi:Mg2+/citrate symporter
MLCCREGRKEVASCTALLMVALVWFGFKRDSGFKIACNTPMVITLLYKHLCTYMYVMGRRCWLKDLRLIKESVE